MMSVEQLVEWELAGGTEVFGENLPSATLSTINITWPDLGSNPGRRRGKPATIFFNSLSGVWSPTGSTRHGGHWLDYCSLPRVIMMTENLVEWRLAGETEVLGENPPQRQFVHHKSHLTRPGIEPGLPKLWHGLNRHVDHKICILVWKWVQTDSFKLSIVGEVYFYRKNVAHTHIFLNRIYM
jgi:hypothetical protein